MEAKEESDYYAILGVRKNASQAKIKKAYHKKSLLLHPDRNPGNPDATKNFQGLSAAYEILSNPASRAKYDNNSFTMDSNNNAHNSFNMDTNSSFEQESQELLNEINNRDFNLKKYEASLKNPQFIRFFFSSKISDSSHMEPYQKLINFMFAEAVPIDNRNESIPALLSAIARNSALDDANKELLLGTFRDNTVLQQELLFEWIIDESIPVPKAFITTLIASLEDSIKSALKLNQNSSVAEPQAPWNMYPFMLAMWLSRYIISNKVVLADNTMQWVVEHTLADLLGSIHFNKQFLDKQYKEVITQIIRSIKPSNIGEDYDQLSKVINLMVKHELLDAQEGNLLLGEALDFLSSSDAFYKMNTVLNDKDAHPIPLEISKKILKRYYEPGATEKGSPMRFLTFSLNDIKNLRQYYNYVKSIVDDSSLSVSGIEVELPTLMGNIHLLKDNVLTESLIVETILALLIEPISQNYSKDIPSLIQGIFKSLNSKNPDLEQSIKQRVLTLITTDNLEVNPHRLVGIFSPLELTPELIEAASINPGVFAAVKEQVQWISKQEARELIKTINTMPDAHSKVSELASELIKRSHQIQSSFVQTKINGWPVIRITSSRYPTLEENHWRILASEIPKLEILIDTLDLAHSKEILKNASAPEIEKILKGVSSLSGNDKATQEKMYLMLLKKIQPVLNNEQKEALALDMLNTRYHLLHSESIFSSESSIESRAMHQAIAILLDKGNITYNQSKITFKLQNQSFELKRYANEYFDPNGLFQKNLKNENKSTQATQRTNSVELSSPKTAEEDARNEFLEKFSQLFNELEFELTNHRSQLEKDKSSTAKKGIEIINATLDVVEKIFNDVQETPSIDLKEAQSKILGAITSGEKAIQSIPKLSLREKIGEALHNFKQNCLQFFYTPEYRDVYKQTTVMTSEKMKKYKTRLANSTGKENDNEKDAPHDNILP